MACPWCKNFPFMQSGLDYDQWLIEHIAESHPMFAHKISQHLGEFDPEAYQEQVEQILREKAEMRAE